MTSLRNNKSTTVVVSLTLTCTRSQFFSISRASFLVESHSRVKDLFCRWLPGVLRSPSPEDVAPRGRGGVEALRIAGGEAEVRARDPSIDAIPRIPSLPREHPLDIPFLGASRSSSLFLRTPTAHRPTPQSHRRGSPWRTTTGSHMTTRCSARTPAARRCPNPRRPRQSSRRWLRWRWTPTRTRLRSTPSSAASPPPPRARSTPSSRRHRSRSPPWAARAPSDDGPSGPPRSSERPAQMPTRKTPKTNAGFEPP